MTAGPAAGTMAGPTAAAMAGATPAATVNAQISTSIKHDGDTSPYIRVAKGTFALRSGVTASPTTPKLTPEVFRIRRIGRTV